MKIKRLSPELVSLVHHVELNESGWWKKAVAQVIKGVLWKLNRPVSTVELRSAITEEIGFEITSDLLDRQLETLLSNKEVQKLPGEKYKLTEQATSILSASRETAVHEQESCKRSFIEQCHSHCPSLNAEEVWVEFVKDLISTIQVVGANTFHLLADGKLEKEADWLANFLSRHPSEVQDGLRRVLAHFFSPENRTCRAQVLRLLTAHFFAEATKLSPETLKAIETGRRKKIIRVVLDTNFIFSVLGLHDNPANDSAISLLDVAKNSGRHLDIRMYVLPGTLDEATRTLTAQLHLIENIRVSNAIARAAAKSRLPSIAAKYFVAAAKAPGLTPQSFFQPYLDDLRTVLKARGIEVLDAHHTTYTQRQDVVDDVHEELERETKFSEDKRKNYETLLHDVILWHITRDRRGTNHHSPFDVEYWAVSIDWRLIGFDHRKREATKDRLPVVLYPTNLVQLVQFWLPRSEELESSLLDSLRLPLFFQRFDPADEQVTVKILEVISRYENVDDLPDETFGTLLANRALRGRIHNADKDNEQVVQLIRDELISEHKKALESLAATQKKLQETELAAETIREAARSNEERLAQERSKREATRSSLTKEQQLREQVERTQSETSRELESERKARQQAETNSVVLQLQLKKRQFIERYLALPGLLGVLLGLVVWIFVVPAFPENAPDWAKVLVTVALGLLPECFSLFMAHRCISSDTDLSDWWLAKACDWIYKTLLIGAPSTAIVGAWQAGIWDAIKITLGIRN